MKSELSKYDRITDILKRSEPVLTGSEAIEENVMGKIKAKGKNAENYNFLDILFGWVYIGWVRNGLIAASVLIVAFFAVQQSIILKRINNLELKTMSASTPFINGASDDFKATMMLYKRSSGKISLKDGKLSEKQIQLLMESIDDLQSRYRDLIRIIDENPELKQYIEKKLSENNKKKFNL
jgi:hypothetical protein